MTKEFRKRVNNLGDLIDIQASDGNWDYDPYMHGMLNGMILSHATMLDIEPIFRDAPEEWGVKKEVNSFYSLGGFDIIEDSNMVEIVSKTWRERITWKFWVKTKIAPRTDLVVLTKDRTIICHPSMKDNIKEEIERIT